MGCGSGWGCLHLPFAFWQPQVPTRVTLGCPGVHGKAEPRPVEGDDPPLLLGQHHSGDSPLPAVLCSLPRQFPFPPPSLLSSTALFIQPP